MADLGTSSEVRERLAGVWVAPPVSIQDLAGKEPAAQTEGQRQCQDQAPERDAESDEDHLLADSEMGDGHGGGEEEDAPADGPGQESGLRHSRVDGGHQGAFTEEVRHEPTHEEDPGGPEDPRKPREHEVRDASRARNGQRLDAEGDENDEDAPEHDEADDLG